jgi:hypothetical protein
LETKTSEFDKKILYTIIKMTEAQTDDSERSTYTGIERSRKKDRNNKTIDVCFNFTMGLLKYVWSFGILINQLKLAKTIDYYVWYDGSHIICGKNL